MFCHNCGTELKPDALFCNKCGTRQEQQASSLFSKSASENMQSAVASASVNNVIQQAEESQAAYRQLVSQFGELLAQKRRGLIGEDVFYAAWHRLEGSHYLGQQAAEEALISRARSLLLSRRNGNLSSEGLETELAWLKSVDPIGEMAICEAQIADLEVRKQSGDVSSEIYSIKMDTLRQEQQKLRKNLNPGTAPASADDTGSAGWAVLGFFFPVIGLVLYLVWKSEKPKTAHQAGTGALVGVVVGIAIWVIYFIVITAMASSAMNSVGRYY